MLWLNAIYLTIASALYVALLKSIAFDMSPNPNIKFSRLITHIFIFLGALFWPLLIIVLFINEKFVNKEGDALSLSQMIEQGQKEIEQQWTSPPYCSQNISYQPSFGLSPTIDAEFTFPAEDVERYFNGSDLNFKQISRLNQDPVIYKWVKNRNSNDTEPTKVPENLDRFQYVALSLINKSKGFVSCSLCGHQYNSADLEIIEDDLKPSWSGVQVSCPNGHLLFYPKTTHLLAR